MTKSTVLNKDRDDRSLLLQGLNLKLKHTYYKSPGDKLKSFAKTINKNLKEDVVFTRAAVKYLKDMGMRLSPAILLAVFEDKGRIPEKDLDKLASLVFTRPDIIANMLAFLQYNGMKSIGDVSPGMKNVIKLAIENMKDITLKKKMMRRRDIKLADLIKVFRPKPQNIKRSALYKGIIENKVRLSKEESVTTLLSDKDTSKDEKVKVMKEGIESMAINSLLRNLSQFTETLDAETLAKLQTRFNDIDIKKLGILNPFDLIVSQEGFNKSLGKVLDNTLDKYAESIQVPNLGEVAFLVDISGSMDSGWGWGSGSGGDDCGLMKAYKFMALLRKFYTPESLQFFHNDVVKHQDFEHKMRAFTNSNKIIAEGRRLIKHLNDIRGWGGTNLHGSVKTVLRSMKADTLFVFTDEQGNIKNDVEEFNALAKASKKKIVMVNVDYDGKTNIDPAAHSTKDFILIAGLNGKIFEYLNFFMDFDNFKDKLKEDYLKWRDK